MIRLNSSRLQVAIAQPGETPNTTTRFDRCGFITEVILDGAVYYCATEPKNLCHPTTGGRGMCSEIVFDVSEECPIGEYFPKFGVGLLKRKEPGRYRIFHKFDDVKAFPVSFETTENSAHFYMDALPCMGYAVRLERHITLHENKITMVSRMTNVGEKPICAEDYCHNFFSIDGMALGSDYTLSMPGIADMGHGRLKNICGENGSLRGWGRGFTFAEMSAVASDYIISEQDIEKKNSFSWKLTHDGARASVEETDDFRPGQVCLWSVDHIVCPEVFCRIELRPGEEKSWTRTWTFETF